MEKVTRKLHMEGRGRGRQQGRRGKRERKGERVEERGGGKEERRGGAKPRTRKFVPTLGQELFLSAAQKGLLRAW